MHKKPNTPPTPRFRKALEQAVRDATTEDQRRAVQTVIDRFFGVFSSMGDSGNNGPPPPPPGDGG